MANLDPRESSHSTVQPDSTQPLPTARDLLLAIDDLVLADSVDDLCHRAVVLAREQLGLERCAIFLEEEGVLRGTFGTDFEGRTVDERLYRPLKSPEWYRRLNSIDRGKVPWVVEEGPRVAWEDGGQVYRRPGWIAVTPILSSRGRIGILCNDAGITGAALEPARQELTALYCLVLGNLLELKQASAELSRRTEQLQQVIRATNDIVYEYDATTERFRFQPTFCERYLFPPECADIPRDWWLERIHPEDRQHVITSLQDDLEQGRGTRMIEYRFQRGDGAYVRLVNRAVITRDANGNLLRLVGSCMDVTEQRRLEERLHEAQKLEAVGRLAGGIAHDFNNLLAVINGYAEMLLADLPEESLHQTGLTQIRQAGERAARLTNQLLAFGRKQVLFPQALSLRDVLHELEPRLREQVGNRVGLLLGPPAGSPSVHVDPTQLDEALLNLALNARDAMPEGGELTLTAEPVVIGPGHPLAARIRPGSYALITVRDTGPGLDAETRARIFEPFFTTKGLGQGTGLSLAMVYGFVAQSGGFIETESAPGRGTEFRLYLPAAEAAALAAAGGEDTATEAKTVLVVEDEAMLRTLIRTVLQAHGYHVFEAEGVQEALRYGQPGWPVPHLVLTDVLPSGGSGEEVAGHFLSSSPETKVLFLSGYTEASFSEAALPAGSAFLSKPFSPSDLIRTIRELLERP